MILSPNPDSARPEQDRGGGRPAGGGWEGMTGWEEEREEQSRDESPWVPFSGFESLGSDF